MDSIEPDISWMNFKIILNNIINKFVPLVNIKTEFKSPWFDSMDSVNKLSANLKHFLLFNSDKVESFLGNIEGSLSDLNKKSKAIEESILGHEKTLEAMQKSIAEFKKQPVHSINTNVGLNATGANHSESEFSVNRFNERVINNINQLATNPTNYMDDYKENFLPNELRSSVCEYLDSCESYNDKTTSKVLYFGRPHKYTRAHNQKTQSEIPAPFQSIIDMIHLKYDAISLCTEFIESLFVTINIGETEISVGVIYRPPSGNVAKFNEAINEILSSLEGKRNVIIMGDFNINMFTNTKQQSVFEENVLCNGFTPTISVATHKKPNCQPSCIDNILVNNADNAIKSGVIETHISHHRSLFIHISVPVNNNVKKSVNKIKSSTLKYDFNVQNLDKLSKLIVESLYSYDIDTFEKFTTLFLECMNSTCKRNTSTSTKRNRIQNPWITSSLIDSISKRDRLYKKWKRSTSKLCTSGDPRLFEEYRKHRNKISYQIKESKRRYFKLRFESASGNLKQTWTLINHLRGKCKQSVSPQFTVDGISITNKDIITDKFNHYFCSLAENLNKCTEVERREIPNFTEYMPNTEKSSIFLEDTNHDEILDIIKEFSSNKSSDIPIVVIKHCALVIVPILCKLFNKCIQDGVFPKVLKNGVITPIHKKGRKDKIENYRPISTLPIFGKIFEKILYKRIYNFVTSQNIISDSQFGFRANHSTSHAIHHSVDFIKSCHSRSMNVLGVFIDLSKAFDTIDHKILLNKLHNYGIRGTPYDLLKSYLSDRYQQVKIENHTSEKLLVKFGVPQGSVLGPLLFILYINDLQRICIGKENVKFVLYADDTNIFIAFDKLANASFIAQKILSQVNNYMVSNLLHINLDKSCFMYFPKASILLKTTDLKLSICATPIKEVTETRFLGVTFDSQLNWNAHITQLQKKLKVSFATIKRISEYIPSSNHKNIYNTIFESHLLYCISVWGGAKKKSIEKIFTLQKRAIRFLFGDYDSFMDKFCTSARTRPFGIQILGESFYRREHTKPLFIKHSLLTIGNLYKYASLNEIGKIIHNKTPSALYKNIQS